MGTAAQAIAVASRRILRLPSPRPVALNRSDPASTLVIGYGLLDNQHSAALLVPIPAAVRPILGGATFSQQAIGLGAAGALRGSQRVTQRF